MNRLSRERILTCISNVLSYKEFSTVRYRHRGGKSDKVAGFDLDHTLIKPKKNKLPTGRDDWVWMTGVKDKLETLHAQGYAIVVFTNQTGKKLKDVMNKITDIQLEVPFPFSVYISTKSDYYYKPMTGMWDLFVQHNGGKPKNAFYCGDAAGREGDWACSDRAFAENAKIAFVTPEKMFLQIPDTQPWSCKGYPLNHASTVSSKVHPNQTKEIVVLTGYPGSGKSTLAKKFKGYVVVSKDKYKTRSFKIGKQTLLDGNSVVVDDTNTNVKHRAPWIALAKVLGVPIRSVYINTDINVAMHMNSMRHQMSKGREVMIPKVAYYTTRKNFTAPTVKEGFYSVTLVGSQFQGKMPAEFDMKYNLL